ncbi:MAG: flagellar hook-associated protein FlgK [Bryobacterales bacterium]|nr:flagellar hook-associated protein FlgK [Bryobacterales bacterium]
MSLFVALQTSAQALNVYQRALAVTQKNVINASTPGYARHTAPQVALEFRPEQGIYGGVAAGELRSLRDEFAERGVRRQVTVYGRYEQLSAWLSQVEGQFDVSGQSGVPAAINRLFSSFSALSVTPNDPGARLQVMARAEEVARHFSGAALEMTATAAEGRRAAAEITAEVNRLAGQVVNFNRAARDQASASGDPGLSAQAFAALEELSELVDIQVLRQGDGSFTVLAGGQVPLVVGDRQYQLEADLSSGPAVILRDSRGDDVTASITGGRLGGAVAFANEYVPGYAAGLNELARNLADAVNAVLAAGVDNQNPPQPGAALFAYNAPADAAYSLSVNPLSIEELAAALPGAEGGNGNALALADLGRTAQIGSDTFAAFYGRIASRVGADATAARELRISHELLATQARNYREERQGVSLDEEAAQLIEVQRAYQANAKVFQVIDSLTETTIAMLR